MPFEFLSGPDGVTGGGTPPVFRLQERRVSGSSWR